jgi:hypothetical protein
VNERGRALLATGRGSSAERQALRTSFTQSPALSSLATLVLATDPPTAAQVAEQLFRPGAMALSTALRRAGTLLAWRRYLLPQNDGPQLRFAALDWSDDVEDPAPPPDSIDIPIAAPEAPPSDADLPPAEAPGAVAASAAIEQPLPPSAADALPDSLAPPVPVPPPSTDALPAVETRAQGADSLAPSEPLVRDNDLAYLRRQIGLGSAILFTGAGFSLRARDCRGTPLPTGDGFARELWTLCYPDEPFDSSSLQDIFEHAHRRHRRELSDALQVRFQVDASALPAWYGRWFSFPWAKIYTLNVDDLESATERQFSVPRRLRTVSALRDAHGSGGHSLDVIHLNGVATDGPDGVTFSTDQFAQRLARQEPFYAQLAVEMLTRPFVFVGSPLEEPLLWQHLALRGSRTNSESELRPRGFLVSPTMNRARADKLRAYHIVWIRATAEEFAERVLSQLSDASDLGLRKLSAANSVDAGDERNIIEVARAVLETGRRTAFLLGEEPSWQDIRDGLAVERDEDPPRLQHLRRLASAPRADTASSPVFAVTATAGAGKTTLLMKIALQLHADGRHVAWIGADSEVAPPALARYYRADDRPPVIIVDDAGRYGPQLVPMLLGLIKADAISPDRDRPSLLSPALA